ncbi:MAG: hypothetical protein V1701_02510 [Planctomycetota bacterium]
MTNEQLAEKIYRFMHTDRLWLAVFMRRPEWEDRSRKTKDRYIRLAEFVKKEVEDAQ